MNPPPGTDEHDDQTWGDEAEVLTPDIGGGAAFDLGSMLSSAMEMQSQMAAAQAEATSSVVEGAAGGGVVRIEVTGGFEFRTVTIDPSAVDPDDVELLQDLVLAALHDAMSKIDALQRQSLDGLGGLGDLLGGGGLGELGGMLGLSSDTAHLLLDDDDDDEDEDTDPAAGR
jgi:nucleoid-associated protein EbfC